MNKVRAWISAFQLALALSGVGPKTVHPPQGTLRNST